MADPNFFKKSKSFTVSEIIDALPCEVSKNADLDLILDDVSSLKDAKSNHLTFLDNIKYKDDFKTTKAGACFVSPELAKFAPASLICLITNTPYKFYALSAQAFYPDTSPNSDSKESNISPSASIADNAKIGKNAVIEHNVVICENVEIGDNAWIKSNTVIEHNVRLGNNVRIGSNATISHALIGDNVRIYTGARIGQDGFGFAIDPAGHVKVPQLGRVIIEDNVEIGANTTIDRGAGPDTIIGQGTWIDNLVQIAHNVQIGRGCIIVAQVGISGSTKIKDFVAIGGQAGLAGHLTIGTGAQIGAQSGVMNDLAAGGEYLGSPAFPKSQFFRQIAMLNSLIKKKKKD